MNACTENVFGTRFADTLLTRAFAHVVQKRPDQAAVVEGERSITYRELDALSDSLAAELLARSAAPVTAVYLPRSLENIIAWTAGAKAGIACAPLGLDWPEKRIEGILTRCEIKSVLGFGAEVYTRPCLRKLTLFEAGSGERAPLTEKPALEEKNGACLPLYIVHTSGSTGEPKGVTISHENVYSQFRDPAVFAAWPGSSVMHVNAVTFDLSVQEIWGSLLGGCTIVVTETETALDPARLRKHIAEKGIEVGIFSTSMFNILAVQDPTAFNALKIITMCGELPSREAIGLVRGQCPDTLIMNTYGPAECTVFAAKEVIDEESLTYEIIPAGHPTPAASLFVVDENLDLLPQDTMGEIVIGSGCVGLGYANAPDLTAAAFRILPATGERVYRTGDYGKMTANGKLIVCGRLDNQIKISGYRVEPGEVRSAVMRHPEVLVAHVLTAHEPDPHLLAYVVPKNLENAELEISLGAYLQTTLPNYMLPRHTFFLPELPLTAHGKVDTARLPRPASASDTGDESVLGMFRTVLGRPDYSEEDSFLQAGGSSIKAARLIAQIRKATSVSVPFAIMTGTRTAYHVSRFLEKAQNASDRVAGGNPAGGRLSPETGSHPV